MNYNGSVGLGPGKEGFLGTFSTKRLMGRMASLISLARGYEVFSHGIG